MDDVYIKLMFAIVLVTLLYILYNLNSNKSDKSEHFDNSEAIQNVAGLYNSGVMTVSNLKVTGSFNLLPKGVILTWTGTTPPDGWALCDGTNGTPDLRGRFIRMFNDSVQGAPAWTGTTEFYSTGMKSSVISTSALGASRDIANSWIGKFKYGDYGGTDHHVLTLGEIPSHSHQIRIGDVTPLGATDPDTVVEHSRSFSGEGGGDRTIRRRDTATTLRSVFAANAGGGAGHNNMPPFYALAFIMKL